MTLIDTHTHLYASQFDPDRDEMIQRAIDEKITRFYLPNIDSKSIEGMLELEKKYPKNCFAMMGLHPGSVENETYLEELDWVKSWLDKRPFVAIGEIGLDLYWRQDNLKAQTAAFNQQIEWAIELDLPIVIHCREAVKEMIEIIKKHQNKDLKGVWHCFTGTLNEGLEMISLGFYLGIGGVVTYKKAQLDLTLKNIPIEKIILETDSPYLAPVPKRGKRNESSYLIHIAQKVAEAYQISIEKLAEITSQNALNLFEKP